jgi:uncharacterized membrane protein
MGTIDGSASIEIEAPVGKVHAVTTDIEGSSRWLPEIKVAECLERDDEGRPARAHIETDAKLGRFGYDIRINYEGTNRISWVQEHGDLKAAEGSWEFEDLGNGRTRATYWLAVEPGWKLGLLVRGPLVGVLRQQLVGNMTKRLKRFLESDSA